jgi:hypothetical protein
MELLVGSGIVSVLVVVVLVVAILWIILPFLIMGTNKRLTIIHNNITDNQEEMLKIQKEMLSCLKKMSEDQTANKDDYLPVKD